MSTRLTWELSIRRHASCQQDRFLAFEVKQFLCFVSFSSVNSLNFLMESICPGKLYIYIYPVLKEPWRCFISFFCLVGHALSLVGTSTEIGFGVLPNVETQGGIRGLAYRFWHFLICWKTRTCVRSWNQCGSIWLECEICNILASLRHASFEPKPSEAFCISNWCFQCPARRLEPSLAFESCIFLEFFNFLLIWCAPPIFQVFKTQQFVVGESWNHVTINPWFRSQGRRAASLMAGSLGNISGSNCEPTCTIYVYNI